MPGEYVSLPANTVTYTDNNPPVPPAAFNYQIRSEIASNPPACRYGERSGPSPFHPACPVYTRWFQCQGGGAAAATGNLGVQLPPTGVPDNPQAKLILQGEPTVAPPNPAGLPGMVFGNGFTGNLTPNNVSIKGWLVPIGSGWGGGGGSGMTEKVENQYTSIRERILSRASAYHLSDSVLTAGDLNNAIDAANGSSSTRRTFTYEYGGAFNVAIIETTGSITLGAAPGNPLASLQTRKAVLLVPGDVTIGSSILSDSNPTGNPATQGFVAIIASGSVTVETSVAVTPTPVTMPFQDDIANSAFPAHISAVIYAQGNFTVNSVLNQLKIDGGVVAMGAINISPGRTSKGPWPAEFVHYNPGMMRILRDVGLRRKVVFEPIP